MSSEHPIEKLSAYVDGELGEAETGEVEGHVQSCETCRQRIDEIRSTKHRLAELGASAEPTDALKRKIERGAEETAGTDGAHGFRHWLAGRRTMVAALAAVVALGIGYYFGTWQSTRMPSDWEELLVRDHLHSKPAAKPMDVTGDDPEAIVRFFRDKVTFEPVVPRVPEATLVGGRLCQLAGEHVELLFYRHEGRVLSLFVSDRLAAPQLCRSSDGHAVCIRRKGHLRLMLVGRGSRNQLNGLLDRTRI